METKKSVTSMQPKQLGGFLISFEGIDFCGKSVQIENFITRLEKHGIRYLLVREPGGTAIAEQIRETLLTKVHEQIIPATEYLLYSAARAQLVEQKIIPALHNGNVVICDRFYDSSTAYQGYGRGIDRAIVQQINHFATQGIIPDLTVLIDIDVDEMEHRKMRMRRELDRMESQTRDFFEKVRQGFLQIARQESERFYVINGSKTIEIIAHEIWECFHKRAKLKSMLV